MAGFAYFKNVCKNIFNKNALINKGKIMSKNGKSVGGTMLLVSPVLFEVKHKEEENSPKSEYIFMAGKSIDFLTQKIFENEFGTSLLYLSFFVAYLALLVHDNKINLMVQKLKFKFSNNMFFIGHPNYKKYLPKNPLMKKD